MTHFPLSQATFDKEIAMCRQLHAEKGGCAWGRCDQCGVTLLLTKLARGKLVEKPDEVTAERTRLLSPTK
jgi:hypothetical protein